MSTNEIKIGSTLWWFDNNRRVYARDAQDHATGSPIHREHWRETKITGESRASWLTDCGRKFAKATLTSRNNYGTVHALASLAEVEAECWIHDHRWSIGDAVQKCKSIATLRAVAALVGYVEGEREGVNAAEGAIV